MATEKGKWSRQDDYHTIKWIHSLTGDKVIMETDGFGAWTWRFEGSWNNLNRNLQKFVNTYTYQKNTKTNVSKQTRKFKKLYLENYARKKNKSQTSIFMNLGDELLGL